MRVLLQLAPLFLTVALCRAEPSAFLENFCFECHDDSVQKGERRFDDLAFPVSDLRGIIATQEIIDQLNLGEMPPKKAEQPSAEERAAVIAALTEMVSVAAEELRGTRSQTVLRRLNQREYLNTVEDLFGRRFDLLAPAASFPSDQEAGHLDNIGDVLVMSSYLLDRHLEAADLIVEKALGLEKKPAERTWHFQGNFQQGQELSIHKRVFDNRYLCIYEVPNTTRYEGSYGYIHEFQEGVPVEGFYEVRVLAHARNRDTPYDPAIFRMDFDEPFRLGIVPGDRNAGKLHHPQPVEPRLAEVTVRDGEPEWYTMRVWLEKGQTPRFIFPNGMQSCRGAFGTIVRRYQDHWPEKERGKKGIVDARRIVLTHGKMPHIRIHEIGIRGPLFDQWPPESQRLVFGEEGFRPENSRKILQRFANRAFRRPPDESEIDRLMGIVEERRNTGHSPADSVRDAIKAILCSPAFLYLAEPGRAGDNGNRLLGPHDLASRLSYFLWSTLPDAELRALADSGEILEEKVLLSQVDRLLDDPRSAEFEKGFTGSWLNLRTLGDMPPDRDTFAVYYAKDLENAMKEEVRLFLRHLVRENRPITDFLDSDYTFVNRPLAQLYRLEHRFDPAKAHLFQRVSLPGRNRGGLLGMAAVHTVTANGIDTSPIRRGVWLLENILGTPPPPPPDDVPVIEPDIRGATTIRDQLEKHRELATCRNCHQKIDPPGFALENFDPIGQWRTHYPAGKKKGPPIDASGQLSTGETFSDVSGFKKALLGKREQFARMLTGRLLAYGIGRRLEALDRPEVDRIVAGLAEEGYGMRTLIRKTVANDLFRAP